MSSPVTPMFPDGSLTKVSDLMTPSVVTVCETDSVRDVLNKMVREHISVVPVINDDGSVIGMVSAADLIKIVLTTDQILDSDYPHYEDCLWAVDLIQRKFGSDKVVEIMTYVVATVEPNETMQNASKVMTGEKIHHLPVVNSAGKLVGILSSSEFVYLVAGTD